MEKNLAALMRTDTKTIEVAFIQDKFKDELQNDVTLLGKDYTLSHNNYTYVSDIPDLKVADLVVVYAVGIPKIAVVQAIHDDLEIKPNDNSQYKWVVQKLDFTAYRENIKKNNVINSTVSKAYRKNTRKQFASILMAELGEEDRNNLLTLIGE